MKRDKYYNQLCKSLMETALPTGQALEKVHKNNCGNRHYGDVSDFYWSPVSMDQCTHCQRTFAVVIRRGESYGRVVAGFFLYTKIAGVWFEIDDYIVEKLEDYQSLNRKAKYTGLKFDDCTICDDWPMERVAVAIEVRK